MTKALKFHCEKRNTPCLKLIGKKKKKKWPKLARVEIWDNALSDLYWYIHHPSSLSGRGKTKDRGLVDLCSYTLQLKLSSYCCLWSKGSVDVNGSEWNRLNFRGRLFVQFSDRWSTHNRLFYSTVRKYIMKHFPGWSICQSVRITVFPTFRTYQKHSLPVNMAVDINKPKFVTNLIIYQRKVKEIA